MTVCLFDVVKVFGWGMGVGCILTFVSSFLLFWILGKYES